MKNGLIVYSTRTGNTHKLARGIQDALGDVDLHPVVDAPQDEGRPWVLVGFWVDRGTADASSLEYLQGLRDQRVGLFGTLGAYPDSKHASDVSNTVSDIVREHNTLLGCFLCQGRIDPELTERFRSFPADHPHAMTPEREKRHRDAFTHPDEDDVRNAVNACREMIKGEA